MQKYLIITLLLISLQAFAAKEQSSYWISHPLEDYGTTPADYLFKTEFKLKDSVKLATLHVAATGNYQLWVNNYLVILNGKPTTDTTSPLVTISDISRFLTNGKNAVTLAISPSATHSTGNYRMALDLKINEETHIVSNKDFICYRLEANQYKRNKTSSGQQLTFDFNPKINIVGNWHLYGFDHKKFSPEKWLSALEMEEFLPENIEKTLLPQRFSGVKKVENITFPYTIKEPEIITVAFPNKALKQITLSLECVKDRTVKIYTPQMDKNGLIHVYTTTFGQQAFTLPLLIKTDSLFIELNDPMNFLGVLFIELYE